MLNHNSPSKRSDLIIMLWPERWWSNLE